jgi:hypothetical protein
MEFNFLSYQSYTQPLSEEFIERYKDRVDWHWVGIYQTLSEEFIERYKDRVDWHWISECQILSEEFIERNKDRVTWVWISIYQTLSEEFIERNKDRVIWYWISQHQILSEEFIERNKDRVDWHWISQHQKLSEEFRSKHNLTISKHNWLYADKETKRKAIEDCGLYTLDGDYVIAYKGIRKDWRSVYDSKYKYYLGGTFKSRANHNCDVENSFGLSAWTEDGARKYCSEKIVKVKVHLDHVAALVHDGHKLRCTQIEIIEEIS